jgi:hypothetical protein
VPSAGGCCVIQAMVLSFLARPNTARGAIKPRCSLASYTDAFWPEAAVAGWRNLRLDSSAFCKILLPATLIRTAGPTRGNPWYATRRLAARAASNVRDGPALARALSDLNGCSMRLDLTIDEQLNLSWTYETLY